jgi:hypothetical protein
MSEAPPRPEEVLPPWGASCVPAGEGYEIRVSRFTTSGLLAAVLVLAMCFLPFLVLGSLIGKLRFGLLGTWYLLIVLIGCRTFTGLFGHFVILADPDELRIRTGIGGFVRERRLAWSSALGNYCEQGARDGTIRTVEDDLSEIPVARREWVIEVLRAVRAGSAPR